eukprot:599975-Pelagomonas_calceolata.AAC.7
MSSAPAIARGMVTRTATRLQQGHGSAKHFMVSSGGHVPSNAQAHAEQRAAAADAELEFAESQSEERAREAEQMAVEAMVAVTEVRAANWLSINSVCSALMVFGWLSGDGGYH